MAVIEPPTFEPNWEFVHLAYWSEASFYEGPATRVTFTFRINAGLDRLKSLVTGDSAWEGIKKSFEAEARRQGAEPMLMQLHRKTKEKFIGVGPVGFNVDWEYHYHVQFIGHSAFIAPVIVAALILILVGGIAGYKFHELLSQTVENVDYPASALVNPADPPEDWEVMGTYSFPLADEYQGMSEVLNATWTVPVVGDGWTEQSFSSLADEFGEAVRNEGGEPLVLQILKTTLFNIEIAGTTFAEVNHYLVILYAKPSPIVWVAVAAAMKTAIILLVVLAAFAAFIDWQVRGVNSVLYPALDFVRAASTGLAFALLPIALLIGGTAIVLAVARRTGQTRYRYSKE